MFRSIVIPAVGALIVGVPLIYQKANERRADADYNLQSATAAFPGSNPSMAPNQIQLANFATGSSPIGSSPAGSSPKQAVDLNSPSIPAQFASGSQFVPVVDFREIFRFDVTQRWVKTRWNRLSVTPESDGLHGLRTALVTGTNSWDLNGSLTYYFDVNHQPQRISFRGWTGDPARLIQLVTQHFGLQPQPTHWAGLYLAAYQRQPIAGMILKDPDIIDRRNNQQRVAVILEINQPQSNFRLSEDFRNLAQAAIPRDQ